MRRSITTLFAIFAVVALAGAGWWLFGWKTFDNPALGLITHRRSFGRVTVLSVDSDRDGAVDAQAFFSWSSPLQGTGHGWREMREDRNHDGLWDTWLANLGKETQFRVDLDGDEEPDWEFTADESQLAYEEIRRKRGF